MDLQFHVHSSDSVCLLFEAWIPAILLCHAEELKEQPVIVWHIYVSTTYL